MNVAIIGKGAIGMLMAKDFEQTGANVTFLSHNNSEHPVAVYDIQGNKSELDASTLLFNEDISNEPAVDFLLVTTKAFQVVEALEQWKNTLSADTTIVILCNGIGMEEQVKTMFPKHPIVRGTTNRAALKKGKGASVETGLGDTYLGWIQEPMHPQLAKKYLLTLVASSHWISDIAELLWRKVAINALINPITALDDIPNGKLSEPTYQPLLTELATEIASLYLAMDIPVSKSDIETNVAQVITNTADNFSSMHQDLTHQRRTEIDYISGQLLSKSEQYHVSMPKTKELFQRIKALENKF